MVVWFWATTIATGSTTLWLSLGFGLIGAIVVVFVYMRSTIRGNIIAWCSVRVIITLRRR